MKYISFDVKCPYLPINVYLSTLIVILVPHLCNWHFDPSCRPQKGKSGPTVDLRISYLYEIHGPKTGDLWQNYL